MLNLPGKIDYDPIRSWVYKWNKDSRKIASDFVTFVDNVRIVGGDCKECAAKMY